MEISDLFEKRENIDLIMDKPIKPIDKANSSYLMFISLLENFMIQN